MAFFSRAAYGLGLIFVVCNAQGTSSSANTNIFVDLSNKVVPSVVNISTISSGTIIDSGDEDEGTLQVPPSGRESSQLPQALSLGTGFIIDSTGLILTNNHVIADADEIKISFTEAKDEKPTDAEVVGRDPDLDIALIRVKSKKALLPVSLGDSDRLEVGEYVVAVGNPFGQGHSVTHGIISAKGRPAPDFPMANYLQTDAPINPGNSGGPLVNLKGEVVGISNAVDQRAQGIGFAIPINIVKKILPQLKTKGLVARGYIGVLVDNLTPEIARKMGVPKGTLGSMVTHVYSRQPAHRAGIQAYDIIVEFNSKPIHSGNDLVAAVTSVEVGESVLVKVLRSGKSKTFKIKVGQRALQPIAQTKSSEKTKGKNKKPASINIGMSIENITSELANELGLSGPSGKSGKVSGVVVSNIDYEGAADKVGIQRGDVILEVDRKPIKNVDTFFSIVKEQKSYLLRIRRSDSQGRESFAVLLLNPK
jgi:serine protease Do